jgi:hypothetical protein
VRFRPRPTDRLTRRGTVGSDRHTPHILFFNKIEYELSFTKLTICNLASLKQSIMKLAVLAILSFAFLLSIIYVL